MLTLNLPPGPIYTGTRAECRELWKSDPAKIGRIWTHEEVMAFLSAGPEEIEAAYARKMAEPGRLLV